MAIQFLKRYISKKYMQAFLKKEKVFHSEKCDVNYVFQEGKKSDKLLVVFSGFPPEGKPPVYNYVLKYRNLKCNKLFILDNFGEDARGSYYLGTNGEWYVIDAITELIESIAGSLGIKKEDITCTGSSKGAFASILYGIRNHYGTVIAGEPQILIGDYLSLPIHLPILKSIAGDVSEENINKLNGILMNLVDDTDSFPEIVIHYGMDGYHYHEHIKPFIAKLDSKGVKYSLDIGSYKDHNDVGVYYPSLVINRFN